MPAPFIQRASWIWSAEGAHAAPAPGASSPSHYQVRMFRRVFDVADAGAAQLEVNVSADSRYLFFCNGTLLGRGPARGDVNHHFYETYDLAPHLRAGRNVLAALVLDMSRVAHRPAFLGPPCGVMTYAGGFVLEGALRCGGEVAEDLSTDGKWKVAVDTAHRFQNENTTFEGYQGYFEHRISKLVPAGWREPRFDDSAWPAATVLYKAERLEDRRDPTSPYGLMPRMIPMLSENDPQQFADVFLPGGGAAPAQWREAACGALPVTIPPNSSFEVILDAGELTTAFPLIAVAGGAGSVVRLTYAEALRLPWETPGAKLLGRRQSLANLASHFADETTGWTFDRRGKITGWCDIWEPAGNETGGEIFEPLHWRAFRYIGVQIKTGAAPLEVRALRHRFTAYPYHLAEPFTCSDPKLEKIWSVALHTMKLCSHETFEDCPYYEQMQYAGDTMITSKIAMLATGDYRLSRQSLFHFDWSRLSDGLTQSRYPSRLVQIIPSWSLHWITNVRDYVYCSGDLTVVRELLPGVTAVLDWFRRHADSDGLPAKLPFWNITDWCPWWPRGVVPGADSGPTCIISAQYIVALEEAANLHLLLGNTAAHAQFVNEAKELRRALHSRFWSESEGLYFDRPGGPELSQYGNAWAILCGAAGQRERHRMLQRFPHDPKLAPGSFFWWHAGFRALELAGAYDRMPEFLGPWHEMVDYGLSTFVEENSYWRSLCHAWSAHPALEFMTRVLGVTPRTPGFGEIDVAPHRCGLTHARGTVCTPRGPVAVSWRMERGTFSIDVSAPPDVPVHLRLPGGESRGFAGGKYTTAVPFA
ncbi:MAG TPA: alpha-L-rhamnosidase C-terminal domain-containing protein [Opitutaceae bacterium]|nr:alpha-L-rhamnosidase C-terminal domain-containing protein [Opitutaceae bacterium]